MGLRALDLFCGMGGLSWGLKETGLIEPLWAIDNHEPALALYRRNLPDTYVLNLDLSKSANFRDLIEKIRLNGGVDLVVGGSPCRGFTQIRNGQDTHSDPNNRLAIKFAEIVRELSPLAFIYENVPQLEKSRVFKRFIGRLKGRNNYRVAHAVVEAANFGNPYQSDRLKQLYKLLIEPITQDLPTNPTDIAQLLNTQALTGNQATKAAVLPKLSNTRIIHLATHGLLDDFKGLGVPGAIAFAPDGTREPNDGLLTSSEIFDLKLNTELVVLSACDTGRGKLTGDGVIGLSRSLITAGVPSVIVSLWSVPDAPTASLMTQFYQNLQRNPDKAQALRQAMLTTMATHPNPKDWAAFTLIGEAQ